MAAEDKPLEVDPRKAREAGWWPAFRGLLIGRPETGALFGAVAMFVIFALYPESSDTFTTRTSIAGMASITAELGIVAMGVTLLMIAGHFDLSVGSVLGVSSVIAPYMMLHYGTNPLLAVLVSV